MKQNCELRTLLHLTNQNAGNLGSKRSVAIDNSKMKYSIDILAEMYR